MTDREKVAKWLECCGNYDEHLNHVGCTEKCPYYTNELCCDPVAPFQDALNLLKEQEAVKPECKIIFDVPYYFCGSCKTMLNMYATKAKYCSNCAKRVKWG